MQALRNFLDHGVLPFVGRKEELGRLVRFWEETAEARSLRIALLIGEAGVGKSRLVQELAPRIEERGGVVVHLRLYPGAMTSLVPPMAQAIAAASEGHMLKGRQPAEELSSVIEGLQRLARLRPVLLVIEDIHLLAEESLAEFTHLLDAVGSESLSVLCLSRPVELTARQALDRYLVEDIQMGGLAMEELRDLWRLLFSTSPDPAAMRAIQEIALGNPLALRSAFRGVVQSGRVVLDERSGRWETLPPSELLAVVVDRNVGMMAGGLMLHLTPQEHDAARSLARLGEVFSREAADTLLPDAPALIDGLLRKGILATSAMAVTAISGPPSSRPLLAFTHTVLHGHLVRHAEGDPCGLVDAIADDIPLYSILPFQLVAKHPDRIVAPPETIARAIARILDIAHRLDCGPDWEGALSVWEAAEKIFRDSAGTLPPDDEGWLHAELINRRITLLRRAVYSETIAAWTRRYLELTASPTSNAMAEYRLRALRFLYQYELRNGTDDPDAVPRQVEELLEEFPSLRASPAYFEYLESRVTIAWTMNLPDIIEQVEEWVTPVLADPATPEDRRQFILKAIMPFFLLRFTTPEQMRKRLDLLADLDATADPHDLIILTQKLEFLWMTGAFAELIATLDHGLPMLRQRGLIRLFNRYSVMAIMARTAFGGDLREVEKSLASLRDDTLTELSAAFQGYLGHCFLTFGLLLGDIRWSRAMLDGMVTTESLFPLRGRILLRAVELSPEGLIAFIDETSPSEVIRQISDPLRALAMVAAGGPVPPGVAPMIRESLARPIIRLADVIDLYGILTMIERAAAVTPDRELADDLVTMAGEGVRHALGWLADRGLFAYLPPMLERFGHRLPRAEADAWRERARTMGERRRGEEEEPTQEGLEISMLGVIALRRPGEERHRVRGARLCALLGAIVANGMLRKPLSHRDFCRLASGESDPEYARKMMNGAVWRLRDLLGQDAVLTDMELPRLNPQLVRVDLLMAHQALDAALHAEREGSLMRAFPFLLTALEIIGGEVPFPGLYDPFFEATREDLENLLRTAIIRVGTGLLEKGDPARAEEMLNKGMEVIGEDEEITRLLARALVALDRRAEAGLLLERINDRR